MPERIERAISPRPNGWWERLEGFDGYVIFKYPGTEKVLLECAVYGNAIFVMGREWKELSKRSKQEALEDPTSERIPHSGMWFDRTKQAMGVR